MDKKKKLFDISKLRRTVIYGLPCDFVQFDADCKDITLQTLNQKSKTEADDDSQNASVKTSSTTPELEGCANPRDCIESINLRAEIWNIMCNIDGLKEELLLEYEQERKRRVERQQTPHDDSHEIEVIKEWCNQFVDDEDDKYNEDHGGLDLDGYVKQMKQPLSPIDDPERLYEHYKSFHTPRIQYDIRKDLHRTDTNNLELRDLESEASNALFNVLNAYSHLDRNVGYVQSMNFITSWILKFTRTKARKADGTF